MSRTTLVLCVLVVLAVITVAPVHAQGPQISITYDWLNNQILFISVVPPVEPTFKLVYSSVQIHNISWIESDDQWLATFPNPQCATMFFIEFPGDPSPIFTYNLTAVDNNDKYFIEPASCPPVIKDIQPKLAFPGQTITITGHNFVNGLGKIPTTGFDLLVEFRQQGQLVEAVNFFQLYLWGESSIILNLPANLSADTTYDINVNRRNIRANNPITYQIGPLPTHRLFIPRVTR